MFKYSTTQYLFISSPKDLHVLLFSLYDSTMATKTRDNVLGITVVVLATLKFFHGPASVAATSSFTLATCC